MIPMLFIVIVPLCGCFVTEVMRGEDGGVAVSGNLATATLTTFLAFKHLFEALKVLSTYGSVVGVAVRTQMLDFFILQTRADKSFRSSKLL